MAQVCAICGKRYQTVTRRVKTRSAYNPTASHRQKPNLQWYTLPTGKRVKVCVSCLKRMAKSGL